MNLYLNLAALLEQRIQQGLYLPGQRLPSVRTLSMEHGVSLSTVQQAYRVLEDQGLAVPRPRSGYFVASGFRQMPLPRTCRPAQRPVEVGQWDLLLKQMRAIPQADVLYLGGGTPDIGAPTLKPLFTALTRISRRHDPAMLRYDNIQGLPDLREQVARLLVDSGCQLHPNEIVITMATDLEVSQASAVKASIRARVPSLKQREQEAISALGLLVAEPPDALQNLLKPRGTVPTIDESIGIGVPSELAQRRPDIWKAEAELHAATANIGVANANFYPSITLSGSIGFQANQLSDLGSWNTRQFSFGPALSVPVFEGGRLKAMLEFSNAQQRQAALAYQKVVLTAWHEVNNAISGLANERIRQNDLRESVAQSQKAFDSAKLQYKQGTVDYLNVLSVQDMLLNNQSALTNSKIAASLSEVQLYKALGGGWGAPLSRVASNETLRK